MDRAKNSPAQCAGKQWIQQKLDELRAGCWRPAAWGCADDAAQFLAAEREVAEADRLAANVSASTDEELGPIHARYDAATEFIDETEPRSIAAAAVKLRRLLRHLAGDPAESSSLRQVLTFLERDALGGVPGQATAAEPEVIGFGEWQGADADG